MNRTKVGFILTLIGGILSLIYGAALIIINIIAKILSAKMAVGAVPESGFMGMAPGNIAAMISYSPLAIVAGAVVVIFGILLIIASNWIKKTEHHKKGAIISMVIGLIGLILSWPGIWTPGFSVLLPFTVLTAASIITIIGGILAYK
jgi:hypothetical protein